MDKRIILVLLLGLTLESINQYSRFPIVGIYLWWIINSVSLFLMLKTIPKFYDNVNSPNLLFVKMYLFWNIICLTRGLFIAEDYWEWKFLIQRFWILLLPISVYIFTNTYLIQTILRLWFKFLLPAFALFSFIMYTDAVGRYLMPISLILVFFPLLTKKWKSILFFMTLVVLFTDLSARSNVIKFIVPLLISLLYYFKSFIVYKALLFARVLLLIMPIIFLVLGITNVFNIFKMSDYIEGDYTVAANENSYSDREDLTADTRTFLYVEEILSAIKYDYVIFGRTPAKGYESPTFGNEIDKDLKRNEMERFSSEVSILNIFNWTGIVGVILYFVIFIRASFLALNKSKNWSVKFMGVYVAFRWMYAWVEDYSSFDLSFIFLFIALSICYSESFRKMTDNEFKYWLYGIFDKKYREAVVKLQLVQKDNS